MIGPGLVQRRARSRSARPCSICDGRPKTLDQIQNQQFLGSLTPESTRVATSPSLRSYRHRCQTYEEAPQARGSACCRAHRIFRASDRSLPHTRKILPRTNSRSPAPRLGPIARLEVSTRTNFQCFTNLSFLSPFPVFYFPQSELFFSVHFRKGSHSPLCINLQLHDSNTLVR
jgi:hypothetical protein